ncbi:MAG: hypothetical protein ACFFG0_01945 [Candidatus Thorarchaeota archaeon]
MSYYVSNRTIPSSYIRSDSSSSHEKFLKKWIKSIEKEKEEEQKKIMKKMAIGDEKILFNPENLVL